MGKTTKMITKLAVALTMGLTAAAASAQTGAGVSLQKIHGAYETVDHIGSYVAYIGPRDLTNSRGVRLTDAAAILQQDRANHHALGRGDIWDDGDDMFLSRHARDSIGDWIAKGDMPPHVAAAIRAGGVSVWVDVKWGAYRGYFIEVSIAH